MVFSCATSWENLFMPYTNNKGADQPAHPRSLVSAFIVHCLDSLSNTSTYYSQNFKTIASLISRADRLESYLVRNPEDKFSRDMAHIYQVYLPLLPSYFWTSSTLRHLLSGTLTGTLLCILGPENRIFNCVMGVYQNLYGIFVFEYNLLVFQPFNIISVITRSSGGKWKISKPYKIKIYNNIYKYNGPWLLLATDPAWFRQRILYDPLY